MNFLHKNHEKIAVATVGCERLKLTWWLATVGNAIFISNKAEKR